MLTDPKISFFTLFSLHFLPNSSPKLNSMGHDQEQESAKAGHCYSFSVVGGGEELMTDFSCQFLDRRIVRKSHLLHSPLAMTKAQWET